MKIDSRGLHLCQVRGITISKSRFLPAPITVRTEKTRDFVTLSLADNDINQIMIHIKITPEVKKLLKEAIE